MLKIGVLGAGHLGKIHIKCIKEIPEYDLIGFFDPDEENSEKVEKEFDIRRYNSLDELVDAVDMVDIVTPTISHFECASKSLKKFRHVFLEKPIVTTLDEARELIKIAEEANVKVQVGHVERFNPAFLAAEPYLRCRSGMLSGLTRPFLLRNPISANPCLLKPTGWPNSIPGAPMSPSSSTL